MSKAVVFLGKTPVAFKAEVYQELLQDEALLDRILSHPAALEGRMSVAVREVLVPEAVRRGYKPVYLDELKEGPLGSTRRERGAKK